MGRRSSKYPAGDPHNPGCERQTERQTHTSGASMATVCSYVGACTHACVHASTRDEWPVCMYVALIARNVRRSRSGRAQLSTQYSTQIKTPALGHAHCCDDMPCHHGSGCQAHRAPPTVLVCGNIGPPTVACPGAGGVLHGWQQDAGWERDRSATQTRTQWCETPYACGGVTNCR